MIAQREQSYKIWLFIADAVSLAASFILAVTCRFYIFAGWFSKQGTFGQQIYLLPYVVLIWLVAYRFSGLYSPVLRGSEEVLAIFKGVIVGVLLALAAVFFFRAEADSRGLLAFFGALALILTFTGRVVLRWLRYRIMRQARSLSRLVIIGHNQLGVTLAGELMKRPIGYEIIGFMDETSTPAPEVELDDTVRPLPPRLNAGLDDLARVIADQSVDEVWIALKDAPRVRVKQLVEVCLNAKISWRIVPDLYEVMLDWMRVDSLAGIPLIGIKRSNITGFNVWIKRALDLAGSGILIAILAIPMGIIALLIKMVSPGPALFMQKRVGLNGKRFTFLKFRTMHQNASRHGHKEFTEKWIKGEDVSRCCVRDSANAPQDEPDKDEPVVYKIKDDPRVIPYIGRFMRKFSVDELPQVFNVFKGDMSLVGPRPAIAYEVEKYQEWHKRRLETRPGITGLWQVSGRNLLSFEEMVKLDIYYIENWSVGMDFNILMKTFWAVIGSKAY